MSEQPPVQPPAPPPSQPSAGPPTLPMSAAEGAQRPGSAAGSAEPAAGSAAGPPTPPAGSAAPSAPGAPKPGVWQRTTSTTGGRWGLGIAAAGLVGLLILGVSLTAFLVLRHSDRIGLMGDRQDGRYLREDGPGNGRGPFADDRKDQRKERQEDRKENRDLPRMPGGRLPGLGGLGELSGGALHGEVTTSVNGVVQALVFQRGEVTAVSNTSITLKSSDGFAGTYGRTAATTTRGAAPIKGGQAFVLAKASDKVAVTLVALPSGAGAAPSS